MCYLAATTLIAEDILRRKAQTVLPKLSVTSQTEKDELLPARAEFGITYGQFSLGGFRKWIVAAGFHEKDENRGFKPESFELRKLPFHFRLKYSHPMCKLNQKLFPKKGYKKQTYHLINKALATNFRQIFNYFTPRAIAARNLREFKRL